ncbi:hypothetical protein HG536_0D00220 [Torulaspora globosa]|uniref:Cytosolic Fe-S cluster assembly factor NAR1 n=1 Tax=Torulaspora globosa TaxID=48254 RepID=A0A7G3ZG64_9SACH|nr:uncharacterized protein HG536_0D00220 [Torulaspora globosa]QLL32500.1 hypothetical protein HG536_0D00220 [Torulaspora globosa]
MSALLSEEDLNDFISPGLACVRPVETKKTGKDEPTEFEVGKEPSELEKVSISLQDCLACAGCITSSEEILLSRQSHTVFVDAWKNLGDETRLAVSISPQSRISLANYYGMMLDELDLCLANMFKQFFRCKYLVGTQVGRGITISRSNQAIMAARQEPQAVRKPLLSAVCPGFVLYAEKTKPELVPYLLNVKSPQQITGSLLKLSVNEKLYHLAIMPCFDKKLEASRPDGEQEVDCVITPRELVTMFQELGIDLRQYKTQDASLLRSMSPDGWDLTLHWSSNEGSSSGGFAFQYIREMHQLNPQAELLIVEGKNSDVREYRLVDAASDQTLASATELYGFRNIQNMVRKLTQKSAKPRNARLLKNRQTNAAVQKKPEVADLSATDFIEVMACPGGCINGGGLLEGDSTKRKTLVDQLNTRYAQELVPVDPIRMGRHIDTTSVAHNMPYRYQFHPITSRSNDVVSLGNTW